MPTPVSSLVALRSLLTTLSPLGDEAWGGAAPHFCHRIFPAGAYLVEAGQVATDLHFLITGLARFYYLKANGKEFNKSFLGKGQVVGSMSSLVLGAASPFYVQALVCCESLTISQQDFQRLSHEHGDWGLLRLRLLEQLALKQEQRAADFLLLSAQERYEKFLQEYGHLTELIANYHVASYLGITDVALSRIRRRKGLTRVNDTNSR